ncbi:serine O-acetyltransferase [Sphingopyxis sp.]|jgi:serine O-acetyltransferase|uniref:serine O-acetyltransferase n=1 Tax=Sphingopyxis sp. TaxID=1908224 RepID=UPI003F6EEF63
MTEQLTLVDLLKSDLECYFHHHGVNDRAVRKRDLWRNFLVPRCAPVGLYRLSYATRRTGWTRLSKALTWLNFYLYSVEFSSRCMIGPYFFMPHAAGSVIGAAHIGHHAVIYHQVTIGAQFIDIEHIARPRIGDHAFIASGAKIIGDIELGNHCTVGANAVVTKSAGSHQTLTGIPAIARPSKGARPST